MVMKKLPLFAFFLYAAAAFAQTANPVSTVLRDSLANRAKNTVAAFQAMPADKYSFKPTPEEMTFGHLAVHIVQSNYFFCAAASGMPAPKTDLPKDTDDKDKLVAAMQASFDFCTTALASADDSKLGDSVQGFDGKPHPRAWADLGLAGSLADHYGAAAIYLRLNNILPPTAQPKK